MLTTYIILTIASTAAAGIFGTLASQESSRLSNLQLTNELDKLTGRGSFPIATFNVLKDKIKDNTVCTVSIFGANAIENITCQILTIPDFINIEETDMMTNTFSSNPPSFNLGTIRNDEEKGINLPYLKGKFAYIVYFKSNNQEWRQVYWMINEEGQDIRRATVLCERNGGPLRAISDGKIKRAIIDKDFPRTEEGKVKLWSDLTVDFSSIQYNHLDIR